MDPHHLLESFGLTEADLLRIREHGIGPDQLLVQVRHYQLGYPPLQIDKAASPGQGIRQLSATELDHYGKLYSSFQGDLRLCKFVPASGAASRMFRDLAAFLHQEDSEKILEFFEHIYRFAFYPHLRKTLHTMGKTLDGMLKDRQYTQILEYLLTPAGLNLQNLPKALIPFHRYQGEVRTALEEHLVEAVDYVRTRDKVPIHFTVSRDQRDIFEAFLNEIVPCYRQRFQVDFQISLSDQHPSTDMIAANQNNMVFRDSDQQVLFRPGGHGALLKNLNGIEADLIFIKNVDNVATDQLRPQMVVYKKSLAGVLLEHQQQIFKYLRQLESAGSAGGISLDEIIAYINDYLGLETGPQLPQMTAHQQARKLYNILNRPLRVCSVIKSDVPTGGGPYWIKNLSGCSSLQIIENAQLGQARYKNPTVYAHITDLVCGVRNFRGEKFDLTKYSDPESGFISGKNYQGTALRAQEWPGLWNGSMADWNTIVLEVPESIFHPVKTFWDLLSPDHQSPDL